MVEQRHTPQVLFGPAVGLGSDTLEVEGDEPLQARWGEENGALHLEQQFLAPGSFRKPSESDELTVQARRDGNSRSAAGLSLPRLDALQAAIDGSPRMAMQRRALAAPRAAVGGATPIQRRLYLPTGADAEDQIEPLVLPYVLRVLRAEGIAVSDRQRAMLERWSTDGEEHIYHRMFDLQQMMHDADADPGPSTPLPADQRAWTQGLDPVAFAWRKLGGENAKATLPGADRVVIHPNVDAKAQGQLLNARSDFPVRLFYDQEKNIVHAVNILGRGREVELRSYLDMVGRFNVVEADETKTDVASYLKTALGIGMWPRQLNLSVMPISILDQIDPASVGGMLFRNWGAPYPMGWFTVKETGAFHVVCDIRWANGAVVEELLAAIASQGIELESANLHGICGALTPALRRGDLVAPMGEIESLSPDHADRPWIRSNDVSIPGATYVMSHGHVSTIMEEDDESLARLLQDREVQTLEMEAYHFIRGLEAMGHRGYVRVVFTVSDVMTSPYENLGQPEERTDETLLARKTRNKAVIEAFGLGTSTDVAPTTMTYGSTGSPGTSASHGF